MSEIQQEFVAQETTEVVNAEVQQSEEVSTSEQDATLAQDGAAQIEEPKAEKMLTQSEVNKLIAREKARAERKAQEKIMSQMQQFQQVQGSEQFAQAGTENGNGLSKEYVLSVIEQAAAEKARMTQAEQIAAQYTQKIEHAIQQDPNFADLYDEMNVEQFPHLVLMLNEFDNTAEIIKDLGENPTKFASILNLANAGMTQLAKKEFKKLSDSIKQNQTAKKQPTAPAPLNQLKPSHLGLGGGELTVSDFRKNPKLRG